ncbi:MAG: flagellar motor protein MotB [Rubellimicrobium sp.]|nr:flagellar motor protein MotB [Rubellimicrobium sp.]
MAAGSNAPIIVRRRRIIDEDDSHGGAWKIAYADFVTAMMAFFMVLWLIGSTTEDQRKGIADYFAPSTRISSITGSSDSIFGGDSPGSLDTLADTGESFSHGVAGEADYAQFDDAEGTSAFAAAGTMTLEDLADALLGRGGESVLSDAARRHVVTRLADDGLVIEVFALPGAPLFERGAEPTPTTAEILTALAGLSALVVNPLAIADHVPSQPVILAQSPVWRLSADRADRVRQLLEAGGLDSRRIRRLTGHGDRQPAAADPLAVRNDRFEVTFLRRPPGR